MTDRLLIIFVRNPILGQIKTRLAATIGASRTLDIYMKLLRHTAKITSELPVDRVVYYSNFIDRSDKWDNSIYYKKLQIAGTLGEKMKSAFEWGFESGYKRICIIGSDCFELTPETILDGFQLLNTYNGVIGPTRDGGYYLLGLKQMTAPLFENKKWGSSSVASETKDDLEKLGITYQCLELLRDVDTEEDLGDLEI